MGLRGPGARRIAPKGRRKRFPWQSKHLSRPDRVIRFIESLKVTSGALAGKSFLLGDWQKEIIREWYATDADGCRIVRTGLLSVARKNGKTGLVSAIALAHLLGPEAERRGQIV